MAKEKNDVHGAAVESRKAPSKKSRPPAIPSDVKAQTQEAKDLRSLLATLGDKNAPETSKDITAFAKETLKIVSKSQKSESAAFRREATKALVDFRNFVEQTSKVSDLRREQLLTQIDSATLDTKSAVLKLISVAKNQAINIKESAAMEAKTHKIAMKEFEKKTIAEAEANAKRIKEDAALKSKAIREEQEERMKLISQERREKYKLWHTESVQKIEERAAKFRQYKEDKSAEINERKSKFALERATSREHLKNLKKQMQDNFDAKKVKLAEERLKFKADAAQQSIELKDARAEAATRIKKMKDDLRDSYKSKMATARSDIAKKKYEMVELRKNRINRLRQTEVEHKAKLKRIQAEASEEALLRKQAFKKKIQEGEQRSASSNKNLSDIGGTIKDSVLEQSPLLGLAIKLGKGGLALGQNQIQKRREKKELNRLKHNPQVGKPAAAAPANGGAAAPAASPTAQQGGFLSGLASGVSGLISGIASVFTGIMGAFSKIAPLLTGGLRFLPGIAAVASVIYGIYSFVEGFNDATKLFGEDIADTDYTRRILSGFTNVFGSILGIFDTVAGWLGFDTDLEGSFKNKVVSVFNAIVNTFKSLLGGVADLLSYIPGMGSTAKSLKAYSESPTPGDFTASKGDTAGALKSKTNAVNDLKDQVDMKKGAAGALQVVQDNSVKQNSTTIVQSKLDTRNSDSPDKYISRW